MITIEGLTQRQKAIAEVLWMINGRDQVESFLKSLEKATRRDAEIVIEMMIAATLDEVETIDPETVRVIDKYRN